MNKKVLIINDSKFEEMVLSDIIKKINFIPLSANEEKGLEVVINQRPAIVIVNYIMKNITGDQLAKKIKIVDESIKCIMSSCDDLKEDQYDKSSVDAVIKTPIQAIELVNVITDVMLK